MNNSTQIALSTDAMGVKGATRTFTE